VPHGRKLAVIGLGYVGLPVAVAFGRQSTPVIGFDIDTARISELKAGRDRTREVEPGDLAGSNVVFTSDPGELSAADFFYRNGADADRSGAATGSNRITSRFEDGR
jgi:UDP-N-acetyl-D-galactosamine dehydrogenase